MTIWRQKKKSGSVTRWLSGRRKPSRPAIHNFRYVPHVIRPARRS
jgi:hypothetical protein